MSAREGRECLDQDKIRHCNREARHVNMTSHRTCSSRADIHFFSNYFTRCFLSLISSQADSLPPSFFLLISSQP